MTVADQWLPSFELDSQKVRLFCFPHAGGGTAVYHRWRTQIAEHVQVVPIRLPGRETRIDDPLYDSLTTLVDDLYADLGPMLKHRDAFFGHSMGALLAFELALRAQADDRAPSLLAVSACRPPDRAQIDGDPIHELDDEALIDRLISAYGMGGEVQQEERGLMAMLIETLRADLKMVETYPSGQTSGIQSPIIACGGAEDPRVTRAALNGWRAFTDQTFTSRVFPGHHFYLRQEQSSLIRFLNQHLSRVK